MTLAFILTQITTAAPAPEAATSTDDSISLLSLLMKGGFIMIPLGILSVISIYIFIERYLYIKQHSRIDSNLLPEIKHRLKEGKVKEAAEFCDRSENPMAKILKKGIMRLGSPLRDIETALENMAQIQVANMEKNLSFLAAIAAIAPMLGFLGTVSGMIRAFHNIATQNNISIGIIAGGIYEKMVTSATGLIVGIIAHILYTYLNSMIDRATGKMELTGMEFIDTLNKPMA